MKDWLFIKNYGFRPPPRFSDMSGYELLLNVILRLKLHKLEGDFVEVGAFLGGGTYKLAKLLEKLGSDKKIYAIDIFDPGFDGTPCTTGMTMSAIYTKILKNRNQFHVYNETTKDCKNVITVDGDSKGLFLPCKKIAFAYIDGNHSPEYIKNDFYLVWDKLVPLGIVAFDDYGYDLPQVTNMIHKLIGEQSDSILRIWTEGTKIYKMFIQKR